MAKITITFEDQATGGVSVVSDPSFETMMKMDLSGHDLTSAHGYALLAINAIRNKSKDESERNNIIKIPRLRKSPI